MTTFLRAAGGITEPLRSVSEFAVHYYAKNDGKRGIMAASIEEDKISCPVSKGRLHTCGHSASYAGIAEQRSES